MPAQILTTPTSTAADAVSTRPRADLPAFVLVGGVPGAGKSTLLADTVPGHPGVRALDPEYDHRRIADALPSGVPYRGYRSMVHLLHAVRTLSSLVGDPSADPGLRALVVHEPATRPFRRALLARLARRQGWRPVLVLLDVSREDALIGQRARGRVVKPSSFSRHWQRLSADRQRLIAAALEQHQLDGWDEVHVVDRESAPARLHDLLR